MKNILMSLALALTFLSAKGQDNPLWMRYSSISPDGKYIAFCYKGDIYKVPTAGGSAVRLTTNPGYDYMPVWSADSKKIAFASDREGGFMRLFVMGDQGGAAKQLSFHSNSATPHTFTKDGKYVIYSAALQNYSKSSLYPMGRFQQLYRVPVDGGTPEKILTEPMDNVSLSPDGGKIVYQDCKGFENKWRKHHTSEVTRDIWQYDFKTKKHEKIVGNKGEDLNPVYTPDGKSIYFLSQRNGGSLNVYKTDLSSPESVKQITNFKNSPARFLSVSDNGLVCFGYEGEIYTVNESGTPNKVKISIINDVEDDVIKNMNFTRGATSATVSPDGKQVAFSIRGEIFVTSVEYPTTKQITQTAAAEINPTFSQDGRSLVYSSYRDGKWDLYKATIERDEDPDFANAMKIKEEKLISDNTEKTCPKFSPDGKEIAFVMDRTQLAVYNLASKSVRKITEKGFQAEKHGDIIYSWSPDSKWFAVEYVARYHAPFSDIGIISAEGGKPVFNITNSGYFNFNPKWAMDGNAIIWNTDRYGMKNHASWGSMQDEMIVFLNKEAYNKFNMNKEDFELFTQAAKKAEKDKKKDDKDKKDKKDKKDDKKEENKPINIEFENMDSRIVRLTPNSSDMGDAIITKDGEKLYYLAAFEEGYDLWVYDMREKSTKLLSKLNGSSVYFDMDKEGKNVFLLGSKSMQKLDVSSEKLKSISYNASMKLDTKAEREFMLEMVRNEVKERFYTKDFHGVKWDKLIDDYKKFLPHITYNYDFSEMLSEILGELNVSHTGSGYSPDTDAPTAQLGVFFTSTDKGLVIDEVVENGPFDNFQSKAKQGVVIEKIDNKDINFANDYNKMLDGKVGKKILVSLYNPKDNSRWEEVVKPIGNGAWNALLQTRWEKQRAQDVEKWSGGKLGYVHISSMNDASFRQAYNDVMGKYYDKEGIVIDIRYNGGGRLHEDVEVLFSGKKYLTQYIQGQRYAEMPSRRWNKKSIMLMNEACYSNAHGTPWVYKKMGLGKLVGMQVAGTMTSVNWVDLQDDSMYFGIPVVGYMTQEGKYLENSDLDPDIVAPLDYAKANQGEDTQLKKAVEELMKTPNK